MKDKPNDEPGLSTSQSHAFESSRQHTFPSFPQPTSPAHLPANSCGDPAWLRSFHHALYPQPETLTDSIANPGRGWKAWWICPLTWLVGKAANLHRMALKPAHNFAILADLVYSVGLIRTIAWLVLILFLYNCPYEVALNTRTWFLLQFQWAPLGLRSNCVHAYFRSIPLSSAKDNFWCGRKSSGWLGSRS